MKKLSGIEWTVMILVVIGSFNWGLLAINRSWNIIDLLFGTQGFLGTLGKLIYGLIGLSGLYLFYWLSR